MDTESGSAMNYDRYGMPLWPRHVGADTDKISANVDDMSPLASICAVVATLKREGKHQKALKILQGILRKRIVTLGHDHPDTCDVRNCVAYLYLKHKRYDEAHMLHYQIKSAFNDRCDLIVELYHEGEYEKALAFTRKIYDFIKQISHPRDLEGLKIRTMTANIYATINKYKEALKIYQDIYQKYFHLYGPDHPDTLSILRKIALVLYDRGKYDEALDTFKDVLQKRLDTLGPKHEDTIISQKDLAELFIDLGKYDKALGIYNVIYDIERMRLEHATTQDTRCDIARVYGLKGECDKALKILGEVYAVQRANRRFADIRSTMNVAAFIFKNQGRYQDALKVYLKLYKSQKHPNHPDALDKEMSIASTILKLDEYDEAFVIFNSLYSKYGEILGLEHTKTLEAQTNVAKILFLKGELEQALKIFNIVYRIQENKDFLGPDHPKTLQTKLNIARVFEGQEKYEEALEIYEEVLEKRLIWLNVEHPEICNIENDIAGVYRSQTKYNKSFQMYYHVFEKRKCILGELHPDTLATERLMDIISDEVPSAKVLVAAHQNKLSTVKSCIEKGDDINARDTDGSTALHLASKQGYVEIIEYLLNKGAIFNLINRQGKAPVDVAERDEVKKLFNIVEFLFNNIREGDYERVVNLIEQEKASVNARDLKGCTPLHWAAAAGIKKIVYYLLNRGANFKFVNNNGYTALHMAVSKNFRDVAETLLQYIKEHHPDMLRTFVNAKTTFLGSTCLHIAAQNNQLKTVRLLLKYGASIRIKNKLGKLPEDLTTSNEVKTSMLASDFAGL